jgi:hypothetical protein
LDALVPCLEEFDPTVKEAAGWAIGYIAQHNAGTHDSQTGITPEDRGFTTVEKGEGVRRREEVVTSDEKKGERGSVIPWIRCGEPGR